MGIPNPRKRPAAFDEVEGWLEEEADDVVLPAPDSHLRLSSYSKSLMLVFDF